MGFTHRLFSSVISVGVIRTCGREPQLFSRLSPVSLESSPSESATHGSSAIRSTRPTATKARSLQLLSFYRFLPISHPETVRDFLFERLESIEGLRGTAYVANEGINAQFAVPPGEPLEALLRAFGRQCSNGVNDDSGGCLPCDKFEENPPNMGNLVPIDTPTFDRLIVRTRNAILRDGINLEDDDGEEITLDWNDHGIELDPSEWDEQLRRPNVQLLDCRNEYESNQGSFVSARPLNTQTFSDTWNTLDRVVPSLNPSKPVYIFCTGGIRCVKVGAYLKQKLGVKDVRSLRHGIIGYERWNDGEPAKSKNEPLWVGDNFLFDKRRFAKDDDGSDRS